MNTATDVIANAHSALGVIRSAAARGAGRGQPARSCRDVEGEHHAALVVLDLAASSHGQLAVFCHCVHVALAHFLGATAR